MFDFLKKVLRIKTKPVVPTRLSESEAIGIACETDIASDHKELMTLTTVVERDGKRVWIVNSATIGSMIEVVIDDETGTVIKAGRIGKR